MWRKYSRRKKISILRFADDIVLLTEQTEDLETLLNGINKILKADSELNINQMKLKKNVDTSRLNIKIGSDAIESVRNSTTLEVKLKLVAEAGMMQKAELHQSLYEKEKFFSFKY